MLILKKTPLISCLLALLLSNSTFAQIKSITAEKQSFGQYEKAEFDIVLTAQWTEPENCVNIKLDMEVTAPSGKKLVLPCFYVSGECHTESNWKARFMAQETGEYRYSFSLSDDSVVRDRSLEASFTSVPTNKKGILRPNNYWTFKYDNGEIFRGIGENICWEARANDDSKYFKELHENPRFNYNYMLKTLADNGGNFFRTWMIYWNLPVDWKIVKNSNRYSNSNERYNPYGVKRMDEFVELCDSLGLHVMLALESHAGMMGNGWNISTYNVNQGGPAQTPYEFFTLPDAKKMYKNKLRYMVARWGYSPAIGAWEFFNEVDNAMFNVPKEKQLPHNIVTDWHTEMSAFIKEIDPYGHLVTTSISHRDIDGLNDIATIDFNQKHIYKATSIIPKTLTEYANAHNKPYVIGEFGYEWDWHINFNEIASGMDSDFKRGLWYGLFNPTPIMPMSWWWEFFDERGMKKYFRGVRQISDEMIQAGKGSFEVIDIIAPNISAYSVKCGDKIFVYLYNESQTNVQQPVKLITENKNYVVQTFCPESLASGKLDNPEIAENGIKIKNVKLPANAEMVLILEKTNEVGLK